jgi:predicted dehydrogenase
MQRHKVGKVIMVNLTVKNLFPHNNPSLNTAWQKEPSSYGGLFVDAFIHAAGSLHSIVPGDVWQVLAITSHIAKHLPLPDTLVSHVLWASNVAGSISVSYACDTFKYKFEVTGSKGTILLRCSTSRPGYDLIITKGMRSLEIVEGEFCEYKGLDNEFLAFAMSCKGGLGCDRDENTPIEALKDLELVEALLESGRQCGVIITL